MNMGLRPGAARARILRAADNLPPPDPTRAQVLAAAAPVALLQGAVHGAGLASLDGIAAGRFTLLNRDFDFGDAGNVAWRGDFHDGGNPLRRMTLSYMGYCVPLLARGREADARTVLALLRSFEAANGFAVPGVFGDVWNPYAASHRLINLLAGLALYRQGGRAPPEPAEAGILAHVRFCAAYVAANLERDLQYNHLMKNLTALAFYAAGLDQAPASLAFLRDAVPRSVHQCVLGDGGHAERSPMYHLLALLDVDTLLATGLFEGRWRSELGDVRSRMAAALGVMTHPDGDIALFNDAWIGEAPPARELIGPAAVPATARLAETGYVRLGGDGDGDGGDALLFDCGPCGPDDNPAHAHGDFLSLELSAGAHRLIVDPGVATYTAGPARARTRSAESHNGPHIAGLEPVEFWKSFRVGRRGRAFEIDDPALAGIAPLWAAGGHDGYAQAGIAVRRYVGLWPGRAALICDLWLGPAGGAETSGFLVPDHWTPQAGEAAAFAKSGVRVEFHPLAGRLGAISSDVHWPRFDVARPAHRLAMTPAPAPDVAGARASALWITWSAEAVPPAGADLNSLFARLAVC